MKMRNTFKHNYIPCLLVFVSILGSNVLSYGTGSFQITPFRIMLLLGLVFTIGKNRGRIYIAAQSEKYSYYTHILWITIAALSILWSIDLGRWIQNMYFLVCGLLCVIIITENINSKEDILILLKVFNWGIILQAFIGVYEIVTKNYMFKEFSVSEYYTFVVSDERLPLAMMSNPNDFGTLMFFGFFISLFCYFQTKKKLYVILCGIEGILLFFSSSRANILALFVGCAALLFMIYRGKAKRWLYYLVCVVCVMIFLALYGEQLSHILSFNFNIRAGNSDSVRIGLLLNGINFLLRSFGVGVGAGQASAWLESNAVYFHGGAIDMHNWWIEILVNYGVIFFIIYLIYYINLMLGCKKCGKTYDKESRKAYLSLLAALIGFVIAAVSSSSNMIKEYLWVLWAIYVGVQKISTGFGDELLKI